MVLRKVKVLSSGECLRADPVSERIANDVLSLSRMQLDSLSIQPSDFELVGETERIVSIFRNEAKM